MIIFAHQFRNYSHHLLHGAFFTGNTSLMSEVRNVWKVCELPKMVKNDNIFLSSSANLLLAST